ncbi:hypothetical protein LCGC14_1530140 [marine sediment metagenome]|uniref:Flagellin N-terminal domain-containing protein n=1 Tax=marine sediment metagenome TaxID=412755 RepID=A0A0F9LBS4_9ZZZZ
MLAIKNNLMATGAARHLGRSYDALAKSVERLSSGLRINSSKDDAAGLAVRELIRADIAVLNQGSRNASDGISMLQTGEGAMAVIDELLIRMKELAEQAATDSYSSDQRTIMNNEYQQLALEITRIAQTTTFNGNALLNSSSTFEIHIGSTDTIDIVAQVMDADTLGLGTAGTKVNYSSVHNVANANAAGWTSQAGGDDLDIRIKFTSGANTDITLTTGVSYSLNQIASMVNVASLATADAYNMASTVYNSDTNMYTLKLTGPATGSGETMAITKTAGTAALTAELDSVAGDFGVVAGTDSSGASKVDTKANAVTALTTLGTAINTRRSRTRIPGIRPCAAGPGGPRRGRRSSLYRRLWSGLMSVPAGLKFRKFRSIMRVTGASGFQARHAACEDLQRSVACKLQCRAPLGSQP